MLLSDVTEVTQQAPANAHLWAMVFTGYLAALLIGVTLGLIGGGGSILTLPVLVYLFRIEPALATSYSLFLVGSTSVIGAWQNHRLRQVCFRTVLLFGSTSVIAVFSVRRWVLPAIPLQLGSIGELPLTRNGLTMVLFALLILWASLSMIRGRRKETAQPLAPQPGAHARLLLYGAGIGMVTGFLGAGGGFLLIPALVLLLRLPMKTAIGTSLLIIALNSLIGFTGDIGQYPIDWRLLGRLSLLSAGGLFIGMALGRHLPGEKLRKGFGWFVLLMGIFVLLRQLV